MSPARFPSPFYWGTATAAYQIEGAVGDDGRGPSIWDTFSHTPGKTAYGQTGDVACAHYHLWREDLALLYWLNLNAYRFSISWPRVLPLGTGQVNQRGLDFYDRLVDGLLERGIAPFVTLYHWDLPQALQDRGGWPERLSASAFAAYAEIVARRLGDRVQHWITHNEPQVAAFIGHYEGRHAPGSRDLGLALRAAHHMLLSHGLAVPALRAYSPRAQVGITLNLNSVYPAGDRNEDVQAARRYDGYLNRWFLDPVFGRGYPADMLEVYGKRAPAMQPDDLRIMAAPIDFLGLNNYFPSYVQEQAGDIGAGQISPEEALARGFALTDMGWISEPGALQELLLRLTADYKPPIIYVTENGAAFPDELKDGKVHDPQRIAYLEGHTNVVAEAIARGAPVHGYFLWTLMDNFEWAHGYSKRFGVYYTDYVTQKRLAKSSAHWYRELVAQAR